MKNTIPLSIIGLSFLLSAPYMPKVFVYNNSPSIPRGFYFLSRSATPKIGDNIAIEFEENSGHLILKPVVAAFNDFVCTKNESVEINNVKINTPLKEEEQGRTLPKAELCRALTRDEFFTISSHAKSFDSRYFGVVNRSQINGVILPLYTWGGRNV